MSYQTSWGYTLTNASGLTDFITTAEFNSYTNSKFTNDTRIASNIPSATRAMQNYCGWHIYPNLECEMVYRVADLRDCRVGYDLLIQLPSRMVTTISSILLDAVYDSVNEQWTGTAFTDFDFESNGLLRLYDFSRYDKRSKIRIVFYSGLTADQMSDIKELTAHRVVHAVTSPYGVTSEAAGGVSVTYNASWAGNTRSTALPSDNKEVLQPYVVRGVF